MTKPIHLFLISFLLFTTNSEALDININTASYEELQLLPFTGEKRAQAIINHRKQKGKFTHVDQLLALPEIGPKTYEAMAGYIKTSGLSNTEPSVTFIQKPINTDEGDIQLLTDKAYFEQIIEYINAADDRIDIGMYLFKVSPSKYNRATILMNALIEAKKRDVEVNVLLERSLKTDKLNEYNLITAKKLEKHDITVSFDHPEITSHQKLIIIDSRWTFVGSHNLTHSALKHNHEYSLLIDSPKLALQNIEYLDQIKNYR